jgi:hypothetical protein
MKKSIVVLIAIFSSGCYGDFLDVKADKRKSVPQSVEDFQALLDNTTDMNYSGGLNLAIMSGDEYVIADQQWNVLPTATERNAYLWTKDIFENEESEDWNKSYKRVLYSNLAIEGLSALDPEQSKTQAWKNVMGIALFHRSLAFYELAQVFCDVYANGESAGIPLRTEADVNLKTPRATVSKTYLRIAEDLQMAVELLPDGQELRERPNKNAAKGLLARVYLQMGLYDKAAEQAVAVIQSSQGLLDYSTINTGLSYSFPYRGINNPEVLYMSRISGSTLILNPARFNVNPKLIALYSEADYRKGLFFNISQSGYAMFKGSYFGSSPFFTGIALDEIYLIAAESLVRLNRISEGLDLIKTFVENRYSSFAFSENINGEELLFTILNERRKQLIGRGIYWSDLKRLNTDERFKKTLIRVLSGEYYELLPESSRYILPIPENAIIMGNIEQNIR